MSSEIDRANMCRACMKKDGILLSMYDDKAISNDNLPRKLAELTSIQIDKFDGLPNMLCTKCAYRTNTFYDFKLQVQETEKKLKMIFDNQACTKGDVLDRRNTKANAMQTYESFGLYLPDNEESISNASTLEKSETIADTITDEEQVEIYVSQLNEDDKDIKQNNLRLVDVLSKLQEANENQIGIHSTKTDIPEEISKIFGSQQLDYTIMYVPEPTIEAITESAVKNSASELEQENDYDIFVPTIELLSKQNDKEILDDICVSNSTELKKIKKSKNSDQDNSLIHIKNKDKNVNIKGNSNTKEPTKIEDSDESDSDYFIDPKDNILGSLNDTIMRIKELRKGDKIEYQCTLCLQNYDKLTGVLLHTIDNHIPSSGPFFCVVCEKDCDNHRELRAHAKTHTGRLPYSCFICNKAYAMKRYLKRHMVCHTDFPRHRCPKCGIRFKVKSELESHVRTHDHGAPYSCSQCPRRFNHKGNYKRHLISHLDPQGLHLPKYPCMTCGKRFLNNRTLETHMRVHTGEKPFCCETCGKSFSQQGNLLNHARIHSNPRSYTCEICGKRFNQRATLKDHRLLHTGEKPHVCNVCGIAFTFSAALRRHMWVHAGGKPFGCEICEARFIGKYDLRRHMQVHSSRPKTKRKRNTTSKASVILQEELKEEYLIITEEPDTENTHMEQVLLPQDITQGVHQVESEKENVDALFNLIQYS